MVVLVVVVVMWMGAACVARRKHSVLLLITRLVSSGQEWVASRVGGRKEGENGTCKSGRLED